MSPASAPNGSPPSATSSLCDELRHRPLVVLTVLYVGGLALGDSARQWTAVFSGVLLLMIGTVVIATLRERAQALWLLPIAVMSTGTLLWNAHLQPSADDIGRLVADRRVAEHVVRLRGTVISEVEQSERSQRFYLEAEQLQVGALDRRTKGVVQATAALGQPIEPGRIIEVSAVLREPVAAGNPGQASWRRQLAREQVFTTAQLDRDGPVIRVASRDTRLSVRAVQLRRRMLDRTRATMPGPYAELASRLLFSVVYGMQSSPLPDEVVESFRTAGVLHVLVVSGSQVAFFFLLLRGLAHRVPRHSPVAWIAFVGALGLLAGYYLLCNAPPTRIPSLTRATLMAFLVGVGALLARDVDNLTSLAAAALALLVANPQHLHSVSFQLSFAAVLGIIVFTKPLTQALRLGTSLPAHVLAASLGAQLLLTPLIAHYFGRISLVGVVSNVFIVPLAAALIPLGLLGSFAAIWCEPLAVGINAVNYHGTLLLNELAALFASVPHATVQLSRWSVADLGFCYGGLALGAVAITPAARKLVRPERLIVAALGLAALFVAYHCAQSAPRPLELTMLDAGDGDCLFVRAPSGRTMLIDAGTRDSPEAPADSTFGERVVLPFLLTRKVTRLDVVVITHAHDDHLSGLPAVLRRLPVGLVLDAGEPADSPNYAAVLSLVRDRRIPYKVARRGQRLNLGGGTHAFVLTPLEPRMRDTRSDLNNNSIALKLVYGRFSALLGADLEAEAEERLVRAGDRLRATVLKACHHGSKTSNTEEFLRAVQPRVTLVPCGPSAFQHPAPETLERLAAIDTRVYRADTHGAVTVHSDGTRFRVSTFKDGVVREWQPCDRRTARHD